MKIQVVVCDIDRQAPAKKYTVSTDGGTTELDLCKEHAQPIELLLASAKRRGREAPSRRASPEGGSMQVAPLSPSSRAAKTVSRKPDGRRKAKVTTLEEIERRKRLGLS